MNIGRRKESGINESEMALHENLGRMAIEAIDEYFTAADMM